MYYSILFIGLILFLLNSYRKFKKVYYFWASHTDISKKEKNNFISLLIPVFQEEVIIENTIEYFNQIQNPNIQVYYITTEKERQLFWEINPTEEVLKKLVSPTKIITYPYTTWDKSSQLNYAISLLINKYKDNQHFFAIFDADSRPDLIWLEEIIRDAQPEKVYQMVSIYNTNFSSLSCINKANAILQTRRSFYFELQRLSSNYYWDNTKKLMYLVGHGLIINENLIKQHPLPENSITEDILYWYFLFLSKIYAKPLLYFDYCSVPTSLNTNLIQISRRFYWEFEAVTWFLLKKNNQFLFLKRLYELLLWWYGGSLVFLLFIMVYLQPSPVLLFLFIMGMLFDYLSFKVISIRHFSLWWHRMVILYLFSMIKNILDIIPLSISIAQLFYNKVFKKKQKFVKTRR